jgi:hypothetical protein
MLLVSKGLSLFQTMNDKALYSLVVLHSEKKFKTSGNVSQRTGLGQNRSFLLAARSLLALTGAIALAPPALLRIVD